MARKKGETDSVRRTWNKNRVTQRRNERKTKATNAHEEFVKKIKSNLGPLIIETEGKVSKIKLNLSPENHKKMLIQLRESRPQIQKEILDDITSLRKIAQEYDPSELLTQICFRNLFGDPEKYQESSFHGHEAYVEYALSCILSCDSDHPRTQCSVDIFNTFEQKIDAIFTNLTSYFMFENMGEEEIPVEKSLRFRSILRYINERGDSYPDHHIELIRNLFEPHNSFFKTNYGYTASNIIDMVEEIHNQINENVNLRDFKKAVIKTKNVYEQFLRSKDVIITPENYWNWNEEFKTTEEGRILLTEMLQFQSKIQGNPFRITPNTKIPKLLLDLFSSSIGDNEIYFNFAKSPGWPSNNTIVNRKPIFKYEGGYYGFTNVVFARHMLDILEDLILNKDQTYFNNNYEKKRAQFLELKALDYLHNILPGSQVYHSLYYRILVDGVDKRSETDGLIIYDSNLLIIEAKAGKYRVDARRGGLVSIKSTMKDIIDNAYSQAIRTKKYIEEHSPAVFFDESGHQVLETKYVDFKNIFLINITLENLGDIATQLHQLKAFHLLEGKEWPWSVFINDLRIISEIVENGPTFLLYLQRRIQVNDYEGFQSADELDYFMYFLKHGLYFEGNFWETVGYLNLLGYTDDLDRYYSFQRGEVSSGEKPLFNIEGGIKAINKMLYTAQKLGFTTACIALIAIAGNDQKDLLMQLQDLKRKAMLDKRDHRTFTGFFDIKQGLLFVVRPHLGDHNWDEHRDYLRMKSYPQHFTKNIIYMYSFSEENGEEWGFEILPPLKYPDPVLEEKIKKTHFKPQKVTVKKVPGRNEKCICGSGQKYKLCCGKKRV